MKGAQWLECGEKLDLLLILLLLRSDFHIKC